MKLKEIAARVGLERLPGELEAKRVTGLAEETNTRSYLLTFLAIAVAGVGVAAFHPEAARAARADARTGRSPAAPRTRKPGC